MNKLTDVLNVDVELRSIPMTKIFARFLKDESGATAIEYGLIAALISVALIAGASLVGNELENVFNEIGTQLKSAN